MQDQLYGQRRVPEMYAQIQDLRAAIQAEGSDLITSCWDKVVEHIDFAYGEIAARSGGRLHLAEAELARRGGQA